MGPCSCCGDGGPRLALMSLPAPGILSGPSLIYQPPLPSWEPQSSGLLGVPGGYRQEELPAPAFLAEARDDSASGSDWGWSFFQNILHILCVSFMSEETGTRAICWLLSFSKAKNTLLKVTFWARFLPEAPGPA